MLENEWVTRYQWDMTHDQDFSILVWKPATIRPEEASYVLIKQWEDDYGFVCSSACYENGKFRFFYDDKDNLEIEDDSIKGWDYYPFFKSTSELNAREQEMRENLALFRAWYTDQSLSDKDN